ncbi:hypothetical protein BaRGS_00011013, partial [Batillaria attramentaria]
MVIGSAFRFAQSLVKSGKPVKLGIKNLAGVAVPSQRLQLPHELNSVHVANAQKAKLRSAGLCTR